MKRLACAVLALSAFAAAFPPPAKPSYTTDVLPTLRKKCFMCHTGPMAKKVDLSAIKTDADAKKKLAVLKKSLKLMQAGQMPPKGGRMATPDEIKAFAAWIKTQK
jgi:cytochrome c5